MRYAKVIKGGGREEVFPVAHYTVTRWSEDSQGVVQGLHAAGIELEFSPGARVVRLPDDGNVVYIMNEKGDTTDTYRWPVKERKAS